MTGALDCVANRTVFLDLVRQFSVPTLIAYGVETPPRSRAEIEALAQISGVELGLLPHGKLSIHEEFPDRVAAAINAFMLQPAAPTDP